MLAEYEIAVNMLGHRNTHLKLRERCRLALKELKRKELSQNVNFSDVQLAIYRRENYINYKNRHFPGWDDLPQELRDSIRYPVSGSGMSTLNTMLGLERMAIDEEQRLKQPEPDEPTDTEIEAMLQDYLKRRKS